MPSNGNNHRYDPIRPLHLRAEVSWMRFVDGLTCQFAIYYDQPDTMEAILAGQKLLNKSGEVVSVADALAQKKVIGLYFSAHWCPPCRKFTPLLSYVYDEIKEEHDDIEIVFVSSDRETAQFDEYYSEMPWLALPYAESRDLIPELREKFAVQFIPTLIFFNDKGEIIEREGRTFVEQNMRNVDNLVAALRK